MPGGISAWLRPLLSTATARAETAVLQQDAVPVAQSNVLPAAGHHVAAREEMGTTVPVLHHACSRGPGRVWGDAGGISTLAVYPC